MKKILKNYFSSFSYDRYSQWYKLQPEDVIVGICFIPLIPVKWLCQLILLPFKLLANWLNK